jgi:glycosyltransferase involved in cell wall biosynthesis
MIQYIAKLAGQLSQPLRLKALAALEAVRISRVASTREHLFHLVSCERNAGHSALKCLDSVHGQSHPRHLIRHVFIDDASSDNTPDLVLGWLRDHPGHTVEYVRNAERRGGCANNLAGFRMAPPGSIICELNGDDWLPDTGVISYLNRVYQDPEVWMTYNTVKTSGGRLVQPLPISRDIIETNSFRRNAAFGRHLHTFRQELFTHVREECLIDPETGEFFASGDDLAFYLCLQELSGHHARHLYRTTYIYNFNGYADDYGDTEEQWQRKQRILGLSPCRPLPNLALSDQKDRP